MLNFTTGDMFGIPATHRINTVNCVGVMGAGVALLFKYRHPEMFAEYQRECNAGRLRPGHFHSWDAPSYTVINFPTKRHFKDNSLLSDIENGLINLREWINKRTSNPLTITMPPLGCGNGGLNWDDVKPLIERHLGDANATIYAFEPSPTKWVSNWFSNMAPLDEPFLYDGIKFSTVENFYQAMKLERTNYSGRRAIASMRPYDAKKSIRDRKRFPWRSDWTPELSLQVMEFGLRKKFAAGTSWHEKLVALRDPIVEFNNWGDIFWGVDLRTGKGQNHLGNLLMRIRNEFSPSPIATCIADLLTPKQAVIIKGLCKETDLDADEQSAKRYGLNITLSEITRSAAAQWINELKGC
ncbi:MAG: DUF1768 domain-containing protein [Acidobacteria bacterium]|nr:DUF1768 domain-containing protein [Acidobacteriota bacterium]